MSGGVISIIDDDPPSCDPLVCTECTFKNAAGALACRMCDNPLQQQQQRQQLQPASDGLTCCACTFRNERGATTCCVCTTPLVDDVEMGGGAAQELEGVHKTTGSSIVGSVLVPTRAELKARTVAAGGDHQSATPGLIPRIHERLLGDHNARGSGRGGGGRGNTVAGGGPSGVRERQTFMRG
ncbi:unnamed protein product, partial [Ectocarpus fasciculatus]